MADKTDKKGLRPAESGSLCARMPIPPAKRVSAGIKEQHFRRFCSRGK